MVVALPLLIAMALIPMKNNKEYISKSDLGMWETLTQSSVVSAPIEESTNLDMQEVSTTPETPELKYFIIGGSFKSEENALKYIKQISDQGYAGKDLGIFKGLHRVAMKGFATMDEAQHELNSIKFQNPESGVWIHVNE